jgi:hypothetical protein
MAGRSRPELRLCRELSGCRRRRTSRRHMERPRAHAPHDLRSVSRVWVVLCLVAVILLAAAAATAPAAMAAQETPDCEVSACTSTISTAVSMAMLLNEAIGRSRVAPTIVPGDDADVKSAVNDTCAKGFIVHRRGLAHYCQMSEAPLLVGADENVAPCSAPAE